MLVVMAATIGAGVLEQRELERDRGADHRVLPLQRQRQAPRPAFQ
jgi:hypothetical protein